jgi:uncharacterized membrane protein YcaP (DUF421 family)
MWQMTLPWWESVARAAIVYAFLLLLIRLSGRRTVGQFTPFDLLVVMLLSESVSNALNGGDESLAGGLIGATTLIGLNFLVAAASARIAGVQTALQGEPVLIGKDGRIFTETLKKLHVPEADVRQALREADCNIAHMQCAFLEADGRISILQKPSN